MSEIMGHIVHYFPRMMGYMVSIKKWFLNLFYNSILAFLLFFCFVLFFSFNIQTGAILECLCRYVLFVCLFLIEGICRIFLTCKSLEHVLQLLPLENHQTSPYLQFLKKTLILHIVTSGASLFRFSCLLNFWWIQCCFGVYVCVCIYHSIYSCFCF